MAWALDYICDPTERQVSNGSTLTGFWGYVYKVKEINDSREALIGVLLDGIEVDSFIMRKGDSHILINPGNSTEQWQMIINGVFVGKEDQFIQVKTCNYTIQNTTITMISVPAEYVDGNTYTVKGWLKRNISGTPAFDRNVFITEDYVDLGSGGRTNTTGDFSLTFTYHTGKTYQVEFHTEFDLLGTATLLKGGTITPGATHLIRYTFPTDMPAVIRDGFNTITDPISEITKRIPINTGWDILKIRLTRNQMLVDVKKTGSVVTDVITGLIAGAIAGAIIGSIVPVIGTLFGAALGAMVGIIAGFLGHYSAEIIEYITGVIESIFKQSTNGDVEEDKMGKGTDEFLNFYKNKYDNADKSTPEKAKAACLDYITNIKETYAGMTKHTDGYLFPKEMSNLINLTDAFNLNVQNDCLNPFQNGTMDCLTAINCVTTKGQALAVAGRDTVYNSYSKDSTFQAPWDKGCVGLACIFGGIDWTLIIYIILGIVILYILYKAIFSGGSSGTLDINVNA